MIFEVAFEVVGINILLFVDGLDVVRVIVNVLHSFEIEFREEEALEALDIIIGNDEVLAIYLLFTDGEDVSLHQHQNY